MLSRFVQRYYVLHGCHVLLFVLLRFVPAMRNMLLSTSLPDGPTSQEQRFFMILMLLLAIKLRRPASLEARIGEAMMYLRLMFCAVLYQSSVAVLATYILLWLVLFALAPAPRVDPAATKVVGVNRSRLENLLNGVSHHEYILLMIYSTWSHDCNFIQGDYSRLADMYTSKSLLFTKINIGDDSEDSKAVAAKYRINTSITGKQLPTFILFHRGKEVIRRPKITEENRIVACSFSAAQLTRDFGLAAVTRGEQPPAEAVAASRAAVAAAPDNGKAKEKNK